MKIKISKTGALVINGKKKYCPYDITGDQDAPPCGDWCALFKEPTRSVNHVPFRDNAVYLELCRTQWYCREEEFTDERKEVVKNGDS